MELKNQLTAAGFAATGGYIGGRVFAGEYFDNSKIEPAEQKLVCAEELSSMSDGVLPVNCDANWLESEYGNPASRETSWRLDEDGVLHRVNSQDTTFESVSSIYENADNELSVQVDQREDYAHEGGLLFGGVLFGAVALGGVAKWAINRKRNGDSGSLSGGNSEQRHGAGESKERKENVLLRVAGRLGLRGDSVSVDDAHKA